MKKQYKPVIKPLCYTPITFIAFNCDIIAFNCDMEFGLALEMEYIYIRKSLNTTWTKKYGTTLSSEIFALKNQLLSKKLLYSILLKYKKSHI